ncbi:hypothetical protein T12_8251 [Trichinella patagoniensis]|uniref:Uncharacterized protein n=1 Tax=Trichinella patagoniensis TaxID=990121 RepID=A0A0V1ADE3_9BILA|nr:hypothetical protein T12_8251 [Trichinella patagoniensis]
MFLKRWKLIASSQRIERAICILSQSSSFFLTRILLLVHPARVLGSIGTKEEKYNNNNNDRAVGNR